MREEGAVSSRIGFVKRLTEQAMTKMKNTDHAVALCAITVRYDGNEASSHEIDLNQLGQSIQGFARIFALCSNVLLTGKVNEHVDETDVRVVCSPVAEHRCFEVLTVIKSMATSKDLWSGAFGAVLAVVVQFVLSYRDQDEMKYLRESLHLALRLKDEAEESALKRVEESEKSALKRVEESETSALKRVEDSEKSALKRIEESEKRALQLQEESLQLALRLKDESMKSKATSEQFTTAIEKLTSQVERVTVLIDKLADGLRPSIHQALTPIGRSCQRIELYADGEQIIALNAEHKRAFADIGMIASEDLTPYIGVISEFDMTTGICKIMLHGETARIPAIVIDPVFSQPNNRYVQAMASAHPIRFLAKADRDVEGKPIRLYIACTSEEKRELETV